MADPASRTDKTSTRRIRIQSITDVAETQMCCGCGVCASAQPDEITIVDDFSVGRRPLVSAGADTGVALSVCPGIGLTQGKKPPGAIDELWNDWGPVLRLWEGHASDPEIRFAGSSGGAASALAIHSLENSGFSGVVHTAARADEPILNQTVMSTNRTEILSRTGSRYSPASPADGMQLIMAGESQSVFIGKPCDVAGARSLAAIRPQLADKLGLTIAVFCAGTPSTNGTLEMLSSMGVAPDQVESLRYRGNGWPGLTTATSSDADGNLQQSTLTYAESWGEILQSHRQWRCHLCFDHTGEFADISVGDPWYRDLQPGEAGSSLIVARTQRGLEAIEAAMSAGAIEAHEVGPEILVSSQPNLLVTRGSVWARIRTLRLLGFPAPRNVGVKLRHLWFRGLSLKARVRSVTGTVRRVKRRGLHRRRPVQPHEPATGHSGLTQST